MKVLIWILLLGAAGFGAWNVWGDDVAAKDPQAFEADSLFAVRRGDLAITVTENGYLKAKNDLKIKPEFKREGTITWLIEEGEEVEEGDLLVEVASPEVEASEFLTQIADRHRLSARGYHRILRVARTIADLDGADQIQRRHAAEAVAYRLSITPEIAPQRRKAG